VKQVGSAFLSGVVFAVGLAVAGMTQPAKVVGFLDFFGDWDPSLAVVMGSAVAVHLAVYRLVMKRPSPLLGGTFAIPTRRDISPQLVGGSILFGVGWGLGGYCPGPGIVSLSTGGAAALTFVGAMAIGMLAFQALEALRSKGKGAAPDPRAPEIDQRA
jgi:hypothetical protein